MSWTLTELVQKADWEGGLDSAAEWFPVEDAPEDFYSLWMKFVDTLDELKSIEQDIFEFLDRSGVDW